MAAEPERKIEDSLRAYARKRHEDAGAPLEMHSATRRMLQGEVGKLRAAHPEVRPSWWRSLFLIWPRFAAALGMFAVLATGVWVFTQSEGHRVEKAAEMVSTRAAANQPEFDDLAQLKDRTETFKELDTVAPPSSVPEDAGKKSLANQPTRQLDDPSKLQLRDAENAPALTPARPATIAQSEVSREKQVAVQYDTPAQQPMQLGDTLLAQESSDKRADVNSSYPKPTAGKDGRYYRSADDRAVKLEGALSKERAVLDSSSVITSSMTLGFATQPATANYFAYQDTNALGSLGIFPQQPLNFTNALPVLDAAGFAGDLRPPAGPSVPITEWAASRQVLAENELKRARSAQPMAVGGAEVSVGQRFERQDGPVVPALLQKFELQQHANGRISIRDADGSVYEGEMLAGKNDIDADGKAKLAKDELSDVNRKLNRTDALAATGSASISFRASGTNKNKELVVINGEMLAEEEQLGRDVALAAKNIAEPAPAIAAPKPAATPSLQAPAIPPVTATGADAQTELSRRAQGQAGVAEARGGLRSPERISGVSTSAPAFRANVIRGRVQIGRTNEVQLRAIRTR